MKKEYILPNRENRVIKLVRLEKNKNLYQLFDKDEFPMSITGTLENIVAVDPSGGPYLYKGYQLEDCHVEDIIYKKDEGIFFKLGK